MIHPRSAAQAAQLPVVLAAVLLEAGATRLHRAAAALLRRI